MEVLGIYIIRDDWNGGRLNVALDKDITSTRQACVGDQIYVVYGLRDEWDAYHDTNDRGDEYTTTFIAPPGGEPSAESDVAIADSINQLLDDPNGIFESTPGSLYTLYVDDSGTWNIPYVKWNFDYAGSDTGGPSEPPPAFGYIYPDINIEVTYCTTSTTSTSTSTSSTTETPPGPTPEPTPEPTSSSTSTSTSTSTSSTTETPPTTTGSPTTSGPTTTCCWDCEKTLACFGKKITPEPPTRPTFTTINGANLFAPRVLSPTFNSLTPSAGYTSTTTTLIPVTTTTLTPTTTLEPIITCPVDCNTLGY